MGKKKGEKKQQQQTAPGKLLSKERETGEAGEAKLS